MQRQLWRWFRRLPGPVRAVVACAIAGPAAAMTVLHLSVPELAARWPYVLGGALAAAAVGGAVWRWRRMRRAGRQAAANARLARGGRASLILPLRGEGKSWTKVSGFARTFAATAATVTRQFPDLHVALEIVGASSGTYLQVWTPTESVHQGLIQALLSSFPGQIQIRRPGDAEETGDLLGHLDPATQWVRLDLAREAGFPLRRVEDFDTESLPSILAALMRSADMGHLGIQLVLKAPRGQWRKSASRNARELRRSLAEQRGALRAAGDKERLRRLEEKADAMTGTACTIRVFAEPKSRQRLRQVVSALSSLSRSRYNSLQIAERGQGRIPVAGRHFDHRSLQVVLSAGELAPLWHVPANNAGVVTARGVQIPPPAEVITVARPPFRPEHRILGEGLMKTGDRVFVRWQHGFDSLVHSFICGATGAGKSTLLLFLMLQDICSGYGTILMEPHRDLTRDVIQNLPPERARDVVWINPTDPHRSFGLNLMDYGGDPQRIQGVAGRFMAVLRKILGGEDWSRMPRMRRILENGVCAVLEGVEDETPTLMHLMRFYRSREYREEIVDRVENPVVRDFWIYDFSTWGDSRRNEALGPVFNRVEPMVRRRMVRHVVSQAHTTLPLLRMMDSGKIILLDLSSKDERIGAANARALGTMFVSLVWGAASSRRKHSYPVPTYCWIDEFQEYVTREIVSILAEARGFGLGMNLATQYYERLPTWMQKAVLTNARTKLTSAVESPDEARLMKKVFGVKEEQIRSLEAFHWLVRVSANRKASDTFTMRAFPPVGRGAGNLSTDRLHRAFCLNGGEMPKPEDRGGAPLDFFEGVEERDEEDRCVWREHRDALEGRPLAERARYLADLPDDDWERYRQVRRRRDRERYMRIVDAPDEFDSRAHWIRAMSSLQVEVPRDEIEAERLRIEATSAKAESLLDDIII
jgi:hypothetical protein